MWFCASTPGRRRRGSGPEGTAATGINTLQIPSWYILIPLMAGHILTVLKPSMSV